jgi:sortase A
MKRRKLYIILAAILFLLAAGFTAYPLAANYINDRHQSLIQTDYSTAIKKLDNTDIAAARQTAQDYNERLKPIRYDREAVDAASVSYEEQLNLTGSGIMGYVEIPKLGVNLPIYHGTEEAALQKGVGHLIGSSLPIGGVGTHSVITGHSGVAGKRLFSDLEQLAPGDVFYLRVLDETLAYEVTECNTVLPYETDLLLPDAEKDLCTLVTCVPFGVNSHRLLVRGSRVPYQAAAANDTHVAYNPAKSTWKEQYEKSLAIGGAAALGVITAGLLVSFFRKKRRKRHEA